MEREAQSVTDGKIELPHWVFGILLTLVIQGAFMMFSAGAIYNKVQTLEQRYLYLENRMNLALDRIEREQRGK